jgi:hypothetical protein
VWERVAGAPGICDPEGFICSVGDDGNPWVSGTEFFTDTEYMVWAADLVVVGSRLVLLGTACGGVATVCYPAVWTSTDHGVSWVRTSFEGFYGLPSTGALAGSIIEATAVSEERLVFLGTACEGYEYDDGNTSYAAGCEVVTWTTTDGDAWFMKKVDPSMFGLESSMDIDPVTAITSNGETLAAIATDLPVILIWSEDASGTALHLPTDAKAHTIAIVDNAIVVGGSLTSGGSTGASEPAIWTYKLP